MTQFLLRKQVLATTVAFLSVTVPNATLFANFYVGAFGGGGDTEKTKVTQRGFAFNNVDPRAALSVHAKGTSGDFDSFIAGGHVGYEFPTGICLNPAVEFEGFYMRATSGKETGFLFNPTVFEHEFIDTLPLRAALFFGDVMIGLQFPKKFKWLEPYIGGGIGGGSVWMHHAHSEQDSPAEPGVNHFNSMPSASTSAFAAQFKAGIRFNATSNWRIFGEYRYLYIGRTTYLFGFTQYPQLGHAPTSNWVLELGHLKYNLGVAGVEYRF